MKNMYDVEKILELYDQSGSIRFVARQMHISRNTVSKYLKRVEQYRLKEKPSIIYRKPAHRKISPETVERVHALLEENKVKPIKLRFTAKKIFSILTHEEYKISYTSVKRIVHEWKIRNTGLNEVFIMQVPSIGKRAEFDWGYAPLKISGNNLFAHVGAWGGIIGTFIPGIVLIILGGLWLGTHQPSQVPLAWSNVIPPFTGLASVVLIVSNFLAYAGMEVNAVHVDQLKTPNKDYTKALLVAFGIILAVFIPPTLAVAIAVPPSKLGLTSGITAAFEVFFTHWGVNWMTPIFSLMVVLGALASVVVWIAGPSKGLLIAGRTGLLPPFLQKRNKAGIQEGILIPQGIIVTILAALFVFIPNVSVAFFLLIASAAQLYLLMYILMFISAMRLRVKKPDVQRTYKVPAMNFVAIVGLVASGLAFALGFIPPSELSGVPTVAYPIIVIAITAGLAIIPLIIYALRKPEWKTISDEEFANLIGAHVTPPSHHAPSPKKKS
ncbi:amino acid permease [Athalassotoga sp.]|uniref:APC family permease n=1 Tax=Athalassotoga sp. TaxID=2022597 RepID=UPI003D04E6C1